MRTAGDHVVDLHSGDIALGEEGGKDLGPIGRQARLHGLIHVPEESLTMRILTLLADLSPDPPKEGIAGNGHDVGGATGEE